MYPKAATTTGSSANPVCVLWSMMSSINTSNAFMRNTTDATAIGGCVKSCLIWGFALHESVFDDG